MISHHDHVNTSSNVTLFLCICTLPCLSKCTVFEQVMFPVDGNAKCRKIYSDILSFGGLSLRKW